MSKTDPVKTVAGAQDEAAAREAQLKRQIEDLQKALAAAQLAASPNDTDQSNRLTLVRTASTEQRSKDADGNPAFEVIQSFDKKGNVVKEEKLELYDLKIDLAPSADYIICGGVQYLHGVSYRMNIHTLRSVKEIIHRMWQHEDDIHGRNQNEYRRKISPTVRA